MSSCAAHSPGLRGRIGRGQAWEGELARRPEGRASLRVHTSPRLAELLGSCAVCTALGSHYRSVSEGLGKGGGPFFPLPSSAWGVCVCVCARPRSGTCLCLFHVLCCSELAVGSPCSSVSCLPRQDGGDFRKSQEPCCVRLCGMLSASGRRSAPHAWGFLVSCSYPWHVGSPSVCGQGRGKMSHVTAGDPLWCVV